MASYRIDPVKREDIPEPSLEVFDALNELTERSFGKGPESAFVWKRKDDALVGPFPAMLSDPPSAKAFLDLNASIAAIPGLPKDAREVAIIATGARFQAGYEIYAHTAIAEKQLGMPRAQLDAIARGEKPDGLSEHCEIAFDVTTYLVNRPGPLSRAVGPKLKDPGKGGHTGLDTLCWFLLLHMCDAQCGGCAGTAS